MATRQAPKNVKQANWLFGHPVVRADNNGVARWVKPTVSPLNQKGGGWLAYLYGGVQTNDDWAAVYVPVNELPIVKFDGAQWSYYMTATETMGINMVVWVHDPEDYDKRAEITQLGGHSGLEKASGWNAHEFSTSTTQMFFYGENTTGTSLTAGTQYTWEQFQGDNLFKDWTIYRITFEYGWEASGTFDAAYLAEVTMWAYGIKIPVPLIPPQDEAVIQTSVLTKKVSVTKACAAAGNYAAGDVISESASAGTVWTFAAVARENGGQGAIVKAVVKTETASLSHRLTLYLYNAAPTCTLNDNAANTVDNHADSAQYVGKIDFLALESGSGAENNSSSSIATPSTYGNLPLYFECAVNADDLIGVLVTRDAVTGETATDDYIIELTVEQF